MTISLELTETQKTERKGAGRMNDDSYGIDEMPR